MTTHTIVREEVLTLAEVAKRLSRDQKTIMRYAKRGALKPHRIGISPNFLWSEVLAAVASGKLGSEASVPPGRALPPRTAARRKLEQRRNGGAR